MTVSTNHGLINPLKEAISEINISEKGFSAWSIALFHDMHNNKQKKQTNKKMNSIVSVTVD